MRVLCPSGAASPSHDALCHPHCRSRSGSHYDLVTCHSLVVTSMSVTTIALETTVVPVTVVTPIPVTVTTIYSVPFATSTITSTSTAPSSSASSMPTSVPNPPLPESAIVGLYVPAVVLGSLFGLFTYVKNSVEANHLKKFPKRMYILMSAISIVFSFVASVLSSQHFSDPLLTVIWSRHFNLATDIVTVLGCLAALRAFWKGGSVRMDGSQGGREVLLLCSLFLLRSQVLHPVLFRLSPSPLSSPIGGLDCCVGL